MAFNFLIGYLSQEDSIDVHTFVDQREIKISPWKMAKCELRLVFNPAVNQVDLQAKVTGALLPSSILLDFIETFIMDIPWQKPLQYVDCKMTFLVRKCQVGRKIILKRNQKSLSEYIEDCTMDLISLLVKSKTEDDCESIESDFLHIDDFNEEAPPCPCGLSDEYHKLTRDVFNPKFCLL